MQLHLNVDEVSGFNDSWCTGRTYCKDGEYFVKEFVKFFLMVFVNNDKIRIAHTSLGGSSP